MVRPFRFILNNSWSRATLLGTVWVLVGLGWAWLRTAAAILFPPPSLGAVAELLLWPWYRAELLWRGEPIWLLPWAGADKMLLLLPLALGFGIAVTLFATLLLQAVAPRRWIAGLLIGALVLPAYFGAWQRQKVMQRLFPPGARNAHAKELPNKGILRYTDLSPLARRIISREEFAGWQTWTDMAESFQRVPHRIGPAYLEQRYHMEPREGWGEAWAVVDLDPHTGEIHQFDLVRDPRVPMIAVQVSSPDRHHTRVEIRNHWQHPVVMHTVRLVLPEPLSVPSPADLEVTLNARLEPLERKQILMNWWLPDIIGGLPPELARELTIEVAWTRLQEPQVQRTRVFPYADP